jgi:hypothetical protein
VKTDSEDRIRDRQPVGRSRRRHQDGQRRTGATSLVVATCLSDAVAQVAEAGEDIEQIVRDDKARIKRVRSARKGLVILASLVTLATALASGEAKRIVAAGKAVTELG